MPAPPLVARDMVSTAACCSLFPLDVAGYAARKPGADFVGWGRGWVWGSPTWRGEARTESLAFIASTSTSTS